jgi:hypothetical protein
MRRIRRNRLKHLSIIDIGINSSSHKGMRTTITLDPDVAATLNKEVGKGEKTFKEIVNEALRRGLDAPTKPKKRFVQRTYNGGGFPPWDEIKQKLLDEDLEQYK